MLHRRPRSAIISNAKLFMVSNAPRYWFSARSTQAVQPSHEADTRFCFALVILRLGPPFDVASAFGLLVRFLAKALPTGFRLTAFLVCAFFFEIILVADLVAGGCFSEPELEVLPSRARLMAELLVKTASRLPDLAAGAFVDKRGDCSI